MRATFFVMGLLVACATEQQADDAGFEARAGASGGGRQTSGVAGGAGSAPTSSNPGGAAGVPTIAGASASSAGQGGASISAAGAATAGGTASGGDVATFAGAGGSAQTNGGSGACTLASALVGAPLYDAEDVNAAGNDYVQMTTSGFFLYSDEGHVGTVTPPKLMPALGVTAGNGGKVFRSTGSSLAADFWGAGVGFWLSPCVDVRGITGVSFWLKTDRPVRLDLSSPTTLAVADGGTCIADCVPNSAPIASNSAGSLVKLPFSAFTGGSAPADLARVGGVVFSMLGPGGVTWSYSLELDDLGLY